MTFRLRNLVFLLAAISVFGHWQTASGQSSDQSLPTPVLANEITGRINALDLGDARLTRHFYAFEGNPGDLLITIDSRNLNGDIDVFTAVTFRPLMKTTVYASSQTPEITKGIYLRTHQILILRVEARTPSDDPGTYHVRFGGSFQTFTGGIPVAEASSSEAEAAPDKPNRLTSVGATIPRPPTPITETAEAKPEPSPEKPVEKAAAETEAPKKTVSTNTRRTTGRQTTPRRGTRPAPVKPPTSAKKTETPASTETEAAKIEPAKPAEEKPEPSEKPTETAKPEEKPKPQEVPVGARLIVEEKDGTRIDRPMSTVRRVVVEGNMIVIVLKTGKIERIPMSDVARMAIEPQ